MLMGQWNSKSEVKKGNLGEKIIDQYLLDCDFIPYHPFSDKAHPFDRLVASKDKKRIFVLEVKTKKSRKYYPDTGFNYSNYQDYDNIKQKYGLDIYITFVDDLEQEVYGNYLKELEKDREIKLRGKTIHYPKIENKNGEKIKYYPLEAMENIKKLNKEEIEQLNKLSNENYKYSSLTGDN